jgi:F-type H+-transporting ATPase subunit b
MKPSAKKGLIVICILYAITVSVMVGDFIVAAKPKYPDEVTQRIQQELNGIRQWAYENDPDHVSATLITQKQAREVMDDLFGRQGSIINVNYTLLMQWMNFGVLLLILYGWLWDPLLKFLDERRSFVRQRLAELNELREERTGILDQARGAGQQERTEIVQQARQEAERIAGQTRDRIGEEVRRSRVALQEEVAELATDIAGRLLQREVTRQDHDRIINEMVARMATEPEETGPGGAE